MDGKYRGWMLLALLVLPILAHAQSLTVGPSTLPDPTVGAFYSQTVSADGGTAPYTFSVIGDLPAGITLTGDTLSGTPTAGGHFNFKVQATDVNGGIGEQTYNWSVNPPAITVSPETLPAANYDEPYSASLSASGGIAPYTFVIASGALPSGLSLSPSGDLTGTPTAAGSFSFTVQAIDSSTGDGPYSGTRSYTLAVAGPTLTLSPPSGTLAADYGQPFSQAFTASGGAGPYTYSLSGSLPDGLDWDAASHTIAGTAKEPGNFPISVTATDSGSGASVTQNYTIQVNAPDIMLAPASLPSGKIGSSYSATITASGGLGFYTFSVTSGKLPAGVSLSSGGSLSGTPTAAGTFSFTVTATDIIGQSGSRSYDVEVTGATLTLLPSSLPAAHFGQAYSETLTASGGTAPYNFSVTSGSLPTGMALDASTGELSGTPVAAGTFSFRITATDSYGQSVSRGYSLDVARPTITLAPTSLPTATPEQHYSQTLRASGGTAPYSYAITAGDLPSGLDLDASTGKLSGTPTESGSFTFTATATDSSTGSGAPYTGSRSYTLIVSTVTITLSPTALPAMEVGEAVSQQISASGGSGGYTFSVTDGTLPPGLSLSSSGSLSGTPTSAGSYTFTITATDDNGFAGVRTYTASVVQKQAPPVAQPQQVDVVAGQSVTIDATQGATGGPFTGATVSSPPASGTATVQGTDIVYTAAADASGTVTFEYTLSNEIGASQPAQVTVTINPRPTAPSLSAKVPAGATVRLNLTEKATGGPFTDAVVVSVDPSEAGTATVQATDSGYALDFTAASNFIGEAQITYTLSNAVATSTPAIIRITVTGARPDPSEDAEVLGVLAAQVRATRRMAQGQISNFQGRLEALHDRTTVTGFDNGIRFRSASAARARSLRKRNAYWHPEQDLHSRRYLVQPQHPASAVAADNENNGSVLPDGLSVWTAGAITFGSSTPESAAGIDFSTTGVTIGADQRMGDVTVGAGLGYGHDVTDVGDNGSRSTADSYNVALYGSYHPPESVYVDAVVGYQWLSLEARRYITANGGLVHGNRDGKQWFGSLAVGYQYRTYDLLFVPYARLDVARARLDAYHENGDTIYALAYDEQTIDTTTGNLGVRVQFNEKQDYGVWMYTVRAEYRHDFQDSSSVAMHYFDLVNGPVYHTDVPDRSQDHMLLGGGVQLQTRRWSLRFEYRSLLDGSSGNSQSILLGFSMPLG
ncbi:MAG TPA: putative Ig domain-containing protein [Gammaproteobacteria bacterium]|nr:putative Ig domain-containing protein [Gammaproteobacteria bacterium]